MDRLAVGRVEASQMLGISVRLLDLMLARKEIHGTRVGRRVIFKIEDLQRFLSKDHATKRAGRAQFG